MNLVMQRYTDAELRRFAVESNRIEGIRRTTKIHVAALQAFVARPITVFSLIDYVSVVQPNAAFRDDAGAPNVRVGTHIAPPSGPHIRSKLEEILQMTDPYEQHIEYEMLHPFTDGNGRSGRALFLSTAMAHKPTLYRRTLEIGFLHSWYYLTLEREPGRQRAAANERSGT